MRVVNRLSTHTHPQPTSCLFRFTMPFASLRILGDALTSYVLWFFCMVFFLFHKCMQCRTIRLFAFPLLRISCRRDALPLLCVSHIASPFGALPLLVVYVLSFAVHRHTNAYLFCSVLCLCLSLLRLCISLPLLHLS